ncbi:MAG TPA: AsmA-like C-terminal region-containing protein, partial [Luteimonas sp.]|nr:AsmA-like C-terminal region-containing protein [Luteimonas sp.]
DGDGATVTGHLQRVQWPGFAIDGSASTPATANTPPSTTATSTVDPAKVPPLAFDIAELRIGSASVGAVSLRTIPVAGGLRLQQLQTRSPGQRIDVHGDWIGRGPSARTQLQVTANSTDFGVLLAGFGYGGQLSAGHGTASLNAAWPGSPSDFHLAALTGSLQLAIRDGQLVEVEPGAGRVLGLLSLAQLPRRLTLDFHDFFEKGFAFDKVDGDVRIGGGLASSDNLVIDGPAAEIRIRGAANLMARQYDQTILVLPKAGNLLTAVGAIAGGPVGAAIGAAANQVLKKPLGRLAAKTYRVTGPWKDPKVEVISRVESSRTAPAAPASR